MGDVPDRPVPPRTDSEIPKRKKRNAPMGGRRPGGMALSEWVSVLDKWRPNAKMGP
jgi:hypothetical protein